MTAYPQRELGETMKRLLACLVLCASLSASSQDDNCTVLGIQDLTQIVLSLQAELDSLSDVSNEEDEGLDLPLGAVIPFASNIIPDGWMICDGREIPISDFQALFDVIGTTYGAGDSAYWAPWGSPATTFNIPDLRGRTIIGGDAMGSAGEAGIVISHATGLGAVGGEELHQLTEEELPVVSFSAVTSQPNALPDLVINGSVPAAPSEIEFGGDEPHNVMQPFIALNYIVKVGTAQ